jgi:hypothetical protein
MKALVVVGIIIAVLLVLGLIGSSQVAKIGNTCDLGINSEGSVFCWIWSKNIVGDIQDKFNEILG